jgi:hypothetical protein
MTPSVEVEVARYREITADRRAEALARGYKERHFFAHRFRYLPKCGPDGFKLAQWMCGTSSPNACWEIVLHASPALVDEFPADIFFDDDILWHQQHFGRLGQVAAVDLAIEGDALYTMAHQSDLVQRISRRRDLSTRVEKRFHGWHHMLLNAIANFAIERGIRRIHSPTSSFAMRHTDRKRTVQPELFERIYDRDIQARFPAERIGDQWWAIDVEAIAGKVVMAEPGVEPLGQEKTVCICHDVERGIGHLDVDPSFAAVADEQGDGHLDAMLALERAAKVRASYNVVGALFDEVRPRIARDGHCLAFHSYDHSPERPGERQRQLFQCRCVDYRIKGYRIPRSRPTAELTDENLCLHNFEWIASAPKSIGVLEPILRDRIVRIPIHYDDFELWRGLAYGAWEKVLIDMVDQYRFTIFGLHDCYAQYWLPRYGELLEKLKSRAALRTLDEVAFDAILGAAE